jgi:hypothetical protein
MAGEGGEAANGVGYFTRLSIGTIGPRMGQKRAAINFVQELLFYAYFAGSSD